jgi:hypothetical protein
MALHKEWFVAAKSGGKAGSPAGQPRWGANPAFPTLRLWSCSIASALKAFPTGNYVNSIQLEVRKVGLPPLL